MCKKFHNCTFVNCTINVERGCGKKTKRKYTAEFKESILHECKTSTVAEVSKKHNVPYSTVYYWKLKSNYAEKSNYTLSIYSGNCNSKPAELQFSVTLPENLDLNKYSIEISELDVVNKTKI